MGHRSVNKSPAPRLGPILGSNLLHALMAVMAASGWGLSEPAEPELVPLQEDENIHVGWTELPNRGMDSRNSW